MRPKKKWAEEGVSPVIATILMVAITVVLAAVLYVLVMGFVKIGDSTPRGMWTNAELVDENSERFYLSQVTPETKWTECRIIVENTTKGATGELSYTFLMGSSGNVVTCTPEGGTPDYSLVGMDLAKDGKISEGDYVTMSGIGSGASYKIWLVYQDTGGRIDDIDFSR